MLSKGECEKALRNICETVIDSEADGHNQPRTVSDYCFSETDILKQLIQEHFDNPPLSFNDLRVGMWVWDSQIKEYKKVCYLDIDTKKINFALWGIDWIEFEPNRFYRKQKED